MDPCRYFAKGRCARGDHCRYRHNIEEASDAKTEPTATPLSLEPRLTPEAPLFIPPEALPGTSSRPICRFFAERRCKLGDQCKFRHVNSLNNSTVQHPTHDGDNVTEAVSKLDVGKVYSRDIGGATVQFGPGATVVTVKVASDFSAIRLSGLPIDSTAEALQAFLSTLCFTVSVEDIRTFGVASDSVDADVKVEDPTFAEKATRQFEDWSRRERKPALKVSRKAVSTGDASSAKRIQNSSVTCSWFRPSCLAWLHCSTWYEAKKAEQFLNSNETVLDRKITAKIQEGSPEPYRHRREHIYSVQIRNLNANTTVLDLRELWYGAPKVPKIIMGEPSHRISDNKASEVVKSLLSRYGPLETWESSHSSNGTRMKGMARFQSSESARNAVKELSETKIPQLNSTLLISPLISVKFNVLADMYQAIQAEVATLRSQAWNDGHVHFKSYEPTQPGQKLIAARISGEDVKSVARAKIAFEKVLAGNVVMEGDTVLWDEFFATPAGLIYLKELYQTQNAFVCRDSRKSRLTLHGPAEAQDRLRLALISKVKELSQQTHTIVLSSEMATRALTGGLRQIAARLGKHVASLDVKRKPNTIAIRGSSRVFDTAQLLLNQAQPLDAIAVAPEPSASIPDCVVCWTEAEDAYQTRCGHVYCRDCFAIQCNSAGQGKRPISCIGDGGNCSQIFELDSLREGLTSAQFEDLLDASFSAYVRTNLATFQSCPTPDCPQIYRSSVNGSVITCQSCLTPICTTCHVISHDELSCADYKDLALDGTRALQKWKEERDARDCPTCSMTIEKTEGCNHMECLNCRAHICWFCMAVFGTGPEVYGHMKATHDSFV